MKNKIIEIKEDIQLPGTDIILEKGDRIQLMSEMARFKITSDTGNIEGTFHLQPVDSNKGIWEETLSGSIDISPLRTGGFIGDARGIFQHVLNTIEDELSID